MFELRAADGHRCAAREALWAGMADALAMAPCGSGRVVSVACAPAVVESETSEDNSEDMDTDMDSKRQRRRRVTVDSKDASKNSK